MKSRNAFFLRSLSLSHSLSISCWFAQMDFLKFSAETFLLCERFVSAEFFFVFLTSRLSPMCAKATSIFIQFPFFDTFLHSVFDYFLCSQFRWAVSCILWVDNIMTYPTKLFTVDWTEKAMTCLNVKFIRWFSFFIFFLAVLAFSYWFIANGFAFFTQSVIDRNEISTFYRYWFPNRY